MSDKHIPEPRPIDDPLADFVDHLLTGETAGAVSEEPQDQELRELQDTVTAVWEAFGTAEPSPAMRRRIRENLDAEWRDTFGEDHPSIWARLRLSPVYAVATAAAVVVVMLVILLSPAGSSGLPATAGGRGLAIGLTVVGGVLLMAIAWWFNRDNN